MRFIIISAVLVLLTTNLNAQDKGGIFISIQQKTTTSLQINNKTYEGINPWEIRLSVYHLKTSPIEIGGYLSWGYPSSVDISYGFSAAYLFDLKSTHWLKIGLDVGRFKMGKFKDEVELGATLEDEFHETFKPFVEWKWNFSRYISLFAQAGYRFLRTETETVTEILSRYENGSVRSYRTSNDRRFYGSGFELGIGLSLNLY